MGEVFEAEQTEPIRRRVALKVIKQGMDTRAVVARFDAERQALALMDHPCIARVFDAGATERGRPYFVMEYVEGEPITDYCNRRRLGTRERLELFVRVCAGVQHAHQKAIIHRDLKPSNILVGEVDGRPSPKIIDFGVAKATTQRLTEMTMFTEQGAAGRHAGVHEPGAGGAGRRRHRHADRRLRSGRGAVRAARRLAAVRIARAAPGRLRRDPQDHPGAGPAASEHALRQPGRPGHGRCGDARQRAEAPAERPARRPRLDHDEGAGEGPRPALRNGERAGGRRRAPPAQRAGHRRPAERLVPPGQAGAAQPRGVRGRIGAGADARDAGGDDDGAGRAPRPRAGPHRRAGGQGREDHRVPAVDARRDHPGHRPRPRHEAARGDPDQHRPAHARRTGRASPRSRRRSAARSAPPTRPWAGSPRRPRTSSAPTRCRPPCSARPTSPR